MHNKYKILITGGAGFIGSNLIDFFLGEGHEIICLDNLSTGFEHNIEQHYKNNLFRFINGDIRDLETCREAVVGCDYVLHHAALGSVPRSIKDPILTSEVNIGGFLNMILASKDEGVKRFVYAASSSTYGDSKKLPKVEEQIGKPLSPYAITKYVDELYADVFARTYGMQCIGLRYFNVFGRRQTPDGAYAAVIPLWVKKLLNHEIPVINGDGNYSRDFTYIDNVIQANEKALFATNNQILQGQYEYYNVDMNNRKYATFNRSKEVDNMEQNLKQFSSSDISYNNEEFWFSEVFNIAYGGNTKLSELLEALKENLALFDNEINNLNPEYGPARPGDIRHSQASIKKAEMILSYSPKFDAREGFERVAEWYYNNLR
jgi:UDP-N-acetylglucosamine/UDP-N-acetylgalactosamine 4-epimerase